MGMHCLQILNNQKVLDCSGRKENIPLDLINSWTWHEFHKRRLSYRMYSYCNTEEGNVFVWGYGILGKGPNLIETAVPKMIPPSLFGWSDFNPDIRVAHVRCGLSQFAAITSKFLVLLLWRGHIAVLLASRRKKKCPSLFKLGAHWKATGGAGSMFTSVSMSNVGTALTYALIKKVLFF